MMKMTIHEEVVEAVILKKTPYKENDMILHIYSHEYGKMSVMARGIRKMTSKNARGCQEMMLSELTIALKKGMSTLIKATPLDYFRHIEENLESEIVGQYILEYFYRYVEDNQPLEKEYRMLYEALHALDLGYPPLLVYLLFNVFILEHNGVSLDVDGCVLCGSPQVVSISLEDGGFLCSKHIGHHQSYSQDILKAFRHIHKIPITAIDHLHISSSAIQVLVLLMESLIEEYTGIQLKTSRFIHQIV